MEPTFFATPGDFRRWLETHHATARELLVGFRKKGSGRPSLTWPESVDEALSFGWIDGVRRSLDEESYAIRFTPRKARSTWSAVNVARMAELIREGRVRPAGLAAFERRTEKSTGTYSYEQRGSAKLDDTLERRFRSHEGAWRYFQSRPPGYRKTAVYWVVSAKKAETRERRLDQLIEASARELPIAVLLRPARKP
jgi:uncharacterized protein YdeI (YjbR/CyaY-like superfamily)